MTNTLKITLIAAATLLSLNLNAAQFIMQVKSPDGITVVEGDKGSEQPVSATPEPVQPTTPTANWIQSNYDNNYGYYDNMTCYGQEGNNYETDGVGNFLLFKNGSEADYGIIKTAVDTNSNSYMYADQNNNDVHDNGEQSYYIGNSFHHIDGEGQQIPVPAAQICGYDVVDSPSVIQPVVEGWNESDFYYEDYQPFNFGFYTNMNCSSVAKIVINIDGFRFLDQVIESYDHFTINGNVLTQDMNSVVLSATDENGHDFLYYDTNQNYTLDNNELKFYIGNKITSYQSNINGENYTVDEYAVCTE